MADTNTTKYNAPALEKGLDILEFLSQEGVSISQGDIASGINKTPSEIYRMLVCLEDRGYIKRAPNSGKYGLSLKMYSLSHRHTPFDELKKVAYYPMETLSSVTRNSCHLSIMDNNQLLVISQIRSPQAVSLSIEEGTHFPLSKTTSGKVLLTMFSQEKILDILSRDVYYPTWDAKKRELFWDSLEKIKNQGYFYSESQLTSGVSDISVPIGEKGSDMCAVLAISVFTSSLTDKNSIENLIKALKKAQKEINKYIIQ